MKKAATLSLILMLVMSVNAQNWQWAKGFISDSHYTTENAIAADGSGNIYVTGSFDDTIVIGTTKLKTNGYDPNIYVAKYNANGDLQWAIKAGGYGNSYGGDAAYAISTDNSGSVYLFGTFTDSATFGSIKITADYYSKNYFVAKMSNSGNFNWVKSINSDGYDSNNPTTGGLSTDGSGNIYVTGSFRTSIDIGAIHLTSDWFNVFLAKYNSNGDVLWARNPTAVGSIFGAAVKADAVGNCYLLANAGLFEDTIKFGTTSTVIPDVGFFVVKYNSSGTAQWAQSALGTSDNCKFLKGYAISIDNSGNSYITGAFSGAISFGATLLYNTLSDGCYISSIFTSKISSAGDFLWAKKGGSANPYQAGRSIVADNFGNCYVTGCFSGTGTFGSVTMTSNGSKNAFVVSYNTTGATNWARQPGKSYSQGYAITSSGTGPLYVAGIYSDTAIFGSTSLISNWAYNTFVAKMGNTVGLNEKEIEPKNRKAFNQIGF